MRDESRRPGWPGSFATGSPRPVESRNRLEAGLLACTVPAWSNKAWSDDAFPRQGAVAVSIRCRCLQLRGQPRLGPRSRLSFGVAEEPRSGKATRGVAGGQLLARAAIDATPPPCSPYTLRSGAPTGVKRETGASQALDQGRTEPVLPPQR
ncbi:Uncharacterized protein PPKH_2953 [Pseudomonas putida]|nr:Uncharacterized protein PPKH_2953 [Pseudomonas putida]